MATSNVLSGSVTCGAITSSGVVTATDIVAPSVTPAGGTFTVTGTLAATVSLATPALVVNGAFSSPNSSGQSLLAGATITLPTAGFNKVVGAAAPRIDLIMAAGVIDGQTICLVNTSASSLTFAAAPGSRVADGASAVLPTLRAMILTWNGALWYRQGA